MASKKNKKKDEQALVPWQPKRVLTEADAVRLTIYLTAKAEKDIADEREAGSDYPEIGTPGYEACVAELAYRLAQNWIGAGEASQLQIVDWISKDGLNHHHPRQWETVEQMIQDIGESVSSESGKNVCLRVATQILPFVREHGIGEAVDFMDIIMQGKWSSLYHALPMMTEAAKRGKKRVVRAILEDVKNPAMSRREVLDKWSRKVPIPPARADLRAGEDGTWRMVITMSDEQKRLIVGRLGGRVTFEPERSQ